MVEALTGGATYRAEHERDDAEEDNNDTQDEKHAVPPKGRTDDLHKQPKSG